MSTSLQPGQNVTVKASRISRIVKSSKGQQTLQSDRAMQQSQLAPLQVQSQPQTQINGATSSSAIQPPQQISFDKPSNRQPVQQNFYGQTSGQPYSYGGGSQLYSAPLYNFSRNSGSGSNQPALNSLTEEERRAVIKRVYNRVLCREPEEKNYNYYRYSILTEEGLIKSILAGQEHKNLIDKGNKYDQVYKEKQALESKVAELTNYIDSSKHEYDMLKQVLAEKNRHIDQLRARINKDFEGGSNSAVSSSNNLGENVDQEKQYTPLEDSILVVPPEQSVTQLEGPAVPELKDDKRSILEDFQDFLFWLRSIFK